MKKYFLFFLAIFSFTFAFSQDKEAPKDLLSVPGPLTLNGTEFYLDYSSHPSNTLYIQQYLPKDENFKSFNQLVQFSYYTKEINLEDAVKQKIESIKQKSEEDKFAKSNVTQSPDGKEFIVDYTISETPKKGDSYIEYNIFRFKTIENEQKKNFLIFSYSKRIYGDFKSSSKSLLKERNNLMTEMIDFKIPAIIIGGTPAPKEETKQEDKSKT